jgi:ABC-type transport system involved in multi-copper enzyme maturation permease subunit
MGTEATPTFLLDRKWPFRIAIASWLVIGVAAWFAADNLDRPGQVIVGGLWIVGLALLLRQFILSLFGPVLAFDVLRVGRRPRQIWFRVAYVVLLAFLFAWVYLTWWEFRRGSIVRPTELAKLAETYFSVYMVVQFILVCLLTPASVAGAIAEEKERRTLEFLLATDLRDREILFGKFASRVGSLILFLLAGLPVLALLQFFGGIDPELVLAGFAATLMVVLSLSALSIAASVLSRKARDAIALTYLLAVAYVLLSGIFFVLCSAPPLRWTLDVFGYTVTSEDVGYPFVTGNPFVMVPYVVNMRGRGGTDLFTALGHFTLFHAIVIALLIGWAGWRLRAIALIQMFGGSRQPLLRRLWARRSMETAPARRPRRVVAKTNRPAVGDQPVLWKEVFVDAGLRLSGFGRLVIFGLVGLSFVPAGFIFWFTIVDPGSWRGTGTWWSAGRWREFGDGMNVYLRSAGTVAASLVFLAVAIRGAGAVSGERDRHTMDALLTTPLSGKTIVWGKWWGCILGMRWAWAWIFGIWVLTLAAGGVHPIMFPAAVISIAVYASGFAWIGMFCSLHCRTTLRATMAAILLSVFCGGGYFLVFVMCCVVPLSFSRGPDGDFFEVIVSFLSSFSPPVNLGWLPIQDFDNERETTLTDRDIPYAPFWILGLLAWGFLSFVLSNACVNKFRQMANRTSMAPERETRFPSLPPPLPKRPDPK